MPITSESLRSFPLLQGLSQSDLEALACAAQECHYRARAVIFQAGEACTHLHLVRSGQVRLYQAGPAKLHILALLGPGDVLDATPLLDDGPHIVTARAATPVVLYTIALAEAQRLLAHSPALRLAMLHLVAGQLRQYATHVSDLAFKQVSARLAGVLLAYARPDGVVVPGGVPSGRHLSKKDLAALVGTAREVVVRALKRLEQQGLIAQRPEGIVVLDRAGLERIHQAG